MENKMKESIRNYIEFLNIKLKQALQIEEIANSEPLDSSFIPNSLNNSTNAVERQDHREMTDVQLKDYCKDYPITGKVMAKLLYLEQKFPYAWRISDRKEITEILEGKEMSDKTMGAAASSCGQTLRKKTHMALNIGGIRNATFYGRKEWVEEGKVAFKAEFAPLKRMIDEFPQSKQSMATWK
jgi:hypothetical protein